MTHGAERRRNLRVLFNASTRVTAVGGEKTVSADDTRDISLKGLYVVTHSVIPAGTECLVELVLSGESTDLKLRIQGEVVRTDEEGMGIRFNSMDIDALIHLKNILYYNSGDPDRIDREFAGVY